MKGRSTRLIICFLFVFFFGRKKTKIFLLSSLSNLFDALSHQQRYSHINFKIRLDSIITKCINISYSKLSICGHKKKYHFYCVKRKSSDKNSSLCWVWLSKMIIRLKQFISEKKCSKLIVSPNKSIRNNIWRNFRLEYLHIRSSFCIANSVWKI